ncbi:lysophospholipid acyltransferase family protein [Nisaea nitritireducens]|uniref:lysophospholipid acyltransferase family protein n=1 Tax=Nisaea nitritireducens TaxID=568392 RepID=UPI001867CCCB|nr:lysophospholipid acyltransferase family protein [Nisaea nitritireducens]
MVGKSGVNWIRQEFEKRTPVVSYCNPDDSLTRQVLIRFVELLSGQPRLQRMYDDYCRKHHDTDNFWHSAVEYLRLSVNFERSRLNAIPAEGPLIVVANHPFGVLDGIAVGHITSLVRKDFKLLAHAALGRAEPLRPYLIPIEFDGASSAVRSNVESKRKALTHLNDGGALVIFPAGRVSTSENLFGRATDAPWKLFAGKLIAQTDATVVPIFFEGQNRFLFHLVSRFSEALREALLMNEVARRIGDNVQAHIGTPVRSSELSIGNDRQALLDQLRDMVYGLDPVRLKALASA